MQNTTENEKVVDKSAEVAAPAVSAPEQISSMAEKLESEAPEKRRVFRKACNHTARSVLFQMLIMYAVFFVIMCGYVLISWLINGELISLDNLSDPNFMLWSVIGNAVGATVANVLAGVLHSKKRGYNAGESFKEGRMTFSLFGGGAVMALGAMYLWAYVYAIIQAVTGYKDPLAEASAAQSEMLLSFNNPVGLVVFCLYTCVLAPVTEEYLFRGVLLKTLSKYNVAFAAFATSLMFGLLHCNLSQTPGAFLCGLVLAYVAIRSGSIRTPIILHMIVNIYGTAMSVLAVNMPEHELLLGIISLILNVLFIVGAIVILIVGLAKKKFKWEASEPTTNHTLLPKANSRAKFHLGHFFTCVWVVVLLYVTVETILANGGFTMIFQHVINLIKNAIAA